MHFARASKDYTTNNLVRYKVVLRNSDTSGTLDKYAGATFPMLSITGSGADYQASEDD